MTDSSDTRLGQVLVREGLITDAQLREALARQNPGGTYVPLGQVLLKQQIITQRQLNLALEIANKRPKLGEVLVRSRALSADQLQHALNQQGKFKLPIGQLLVRLNYVTDETMRQALSAQLNVPFVDLDGMTIEPSLKRVINRSYARRGSLVPVASIGQSLTVCMDDPTNQAMIEELNHSTGFAVTVVTASHDAIERAFARLYGAQTDAAAPVEGSLDLITEDEAVNGKSKYADDSRQSKKADTLVKQLLSTAIERRASDIHIETLSNHLQIRFRIDGVLEEAQLGELQTVCNQNAREIVSRLKILGKLDIAERRRPQDGSFRVRVDRQGEQAGVDLRISVVPGYYGESVVLRILDKKGIPGSIDQLGLSPAATEKLRQLLRRPSGILLTTGPTGSGKSTTLFAALMTLYRPEIRILTAEDPVEYVFEQFSQSEVNVQIGNTFAAYLRAFLRHDPEVIMVGEIRDEETAEMAFRAAQTGHLLLSTLHTNTAVAAVTRLLDLKIDPNMLSSSLIGVIGQRLVRELCASCKVPYLPSDEMMREFFDGAPEGLLFYKGRGCNDCHLTGFHGRMIVSELWAPDEEDLILINKGAPFDEIRESARRSTLSMADDALERLVAGRTNLEELIRMLPYTAIYEFRQRRLGVSRISSASPAA